VILIVGDMCYIANVGDSRAVVSIDHGDRAVPMSIDHKPTDDQEAQRIRDAGGQIYQTKTHIPTLGDLDNPHFIIGPHRVMPGRLSVSRTFGDIEAKIASFGGNPNVIIAVPEIKSFKITPRHDFIGIASDGIFDKINNQEFVLCVWNALRDSKAVNVHQQIGKGVEYIIKNSLL